MLSFFLAPFFERIYHERDNERRPLESFSISTIQALPLLRGKRTPSIKNKIMTGKVRQWIIELMLATLLYFFLLAGTRGPSGNYSTHSACWSEGWPQCKHNVAIPIEIMPNATIKWGCTAGIKPAKSNQQTHKIVIANGIFYSKWEISTHYLHPTFALKWLHNVFRFALKIAKHDRPFSSFFRTTIVFLTF